MELKQAIARVKGTENWFPVTLGYQPFKANDGLLQWMIELMEKKYQNIEYKIV